MPTFKMNSFRVLSKKIAVKQTRIDALHKKLIAERRLTRALSRLALHPTQKVNVLGEVRRALTKKNNLQKAS